MKLVTQFDPTSATTGTFNGGWTSGNRRIVVYNESNVNIMLRWDSFTTYCPAWTAMVYCVDTTNANIQWSQLSTLNMQNAPISQVNVEKYENNEQIVGTFPASLMRTVQQSNLIGVQSAFKASSQNLVGAFGPVVIDTAPAGKRIWVQGLDITSQTVGASASTYNLSMAGFDTAFVNQAHFDWDQQILANQGGIPMFVRFPSPMPGTLGGSITITTGQAGASQLTVVNVYYFIQ